MKSVISIKSQQFELVWVVRGPPEIGHQCSVVIAPLVVNVTALYPEESLRRWNRVYNKKITNFMAWVVQRGEVCECETSYVFGVVIPFKNIYKLQVHVALHIETVIETTKEHHGYVTWFSKDFDHNRVKVKWLAICYQRSSLCQGRKGTNIKNLWHCEHDMPRPKDDPNWEKMYEPIMNTGSILYNNLFQTVTERRGVWLSAMWSDCTIVATLSLLLLIKREHAITNKS